MNNITIEFYKSSSKYYSDICAKCESFENFSNEKSKNTLTLTITEIKNNYNKLKAIYDVIGNWTKNKYYLNDSDISKFIFESILETINCNLGFNNCAIKNEYCFANPGWGCSKLNTIELRNEYSYGYRSQQYWYEFGNFKEEIWVIDKSLILDTLNAEVSIKHLDLCDQFNLDRIQTVISGLPEFIEIKEDGDWEYKYRAAPVGMTQTEIIGIKPRDKSEYGHGFSININDFDVPKDDTIDKNIPNVTFNDIGGIDDIVNQVREVIELPIIAHNIFDHYNISPHRGILLYGPPGCGKTLIAKAIANEIKAHFIIVNGPEILNKFVGQSESNLRDIFKEAEHYSPSIIYFDEFDAISATRDSDGNPLQKTVVNQLLTLMDGLKETPGICVIASTNRIDIIDDAIKRPGRFDYKIEVQKPTLEGCKSIFHIHADKMPVDSSFKKDLFAEKYLYGYSGADIAFVAKEAAYNSIRRTINIKKLFQDNKHIEMTSENIVIELDFVNAFHKLKSSISRSESAKYRY